MSVPRTRTHALSLSEHYRKNDPLEHSRVAQLKHPVQRITHRDGSGDPQKHGYDSFYELEHVIQMIGNPMFPFDLNDFDDVKWEDLHQPGVQPSNYSSETPGVLQRARERQQHANESDEEYQRYIRSTTVRQAALQLEQDHQ
jgi:hypothetical protein